MAELLFSDSVPGIGSEIGESDAGEPVDSVNIAAAEFDHPLRAQLVYRQVTIVAPNDRIGDLPNLQQVVLGSAANHPGLVGVPAEVGQVVGVSTVHE